MTLQFSCGFAIHTKTGSTQAVSGFCFKVVTLFAFIFKIGQSHHVRPFLFMLKILTWKNVMLKNPVFFYMTKKTAWFLRRFFMVFFSSQGVFYMFWTSIEFQLRSRGGNRSSEFSQLNIFCNNSGVTHCFKILALFSPRVRIPTRSRLSPIFLKSCGDIQNCFFASMKGNQFFSIMKSIKFDLFKPSRWSFVSGFSSSNFGIMCHILKSADTIVSKNQNKLIKIPP